MNKKTLLVASLLIGACKVPFYSTQIYSPKDQAVYLTDHRVSDYDKKHLSVTKRNWYTAYGFVPISNNSTEKLIPASCKEVGVISKKSAADFALNILIRVAWSSSVFFASRQLENESAIKVIDTVNGASQLLTPTSRTTKVICYELQAPGERPTPPKPSTAPTSLEAPQEPSSTPTSNPTP